MMHSLNAGNQNSSAFSFAAHCRKTENKAFIIHLKFKDFTEGISAGSPPPSKPGPPQSPQSSPGGQQLQEVLRLTFKTGSRLNSTSGFR